jgi:hypothetical protein
MAITKETKPSGPPPRANLPDTLEEIEAGRRAGAVPAGVLPEPVEALDDSRADRVARFIARSKRDG